MKFESKFDVGDIVYFMRRDKITKGKVSKVVAYSTEAPPKQKVYYVLDSDDHQSLGERYENDVFRTKEDLCRALIEYEEPLR